jgi:bacterial/archaeal transporter family protein
MWVLLGLFSAIFLGVYDAVRKKVLKDNPVLPVLFLATLTGALIFLPLIILSHAGIIGEEFLLYVPKANAHVHFLTILKSILVASSWILAYNALNMLPLTIVAPIRSTAPLWTLIGAVIIFSERLNPIQWIGVIIVLTFFFLFALAGKREGIAFHRNKWIFAAIGATLLGAASSLYDKYLFSHFDSLFIQAWYQVYMVPVLLPALLLIWYPKRKIKTPFRWNYFIPLIGILLVISDFLYFFALSDADSLISILSVLRRSSVIVAFTAGALYFRENNLKRKGFALIGILVGIVLIFWSTLR